MAIDIVNAGWVPIYNLNLSEDVPGYIDAGERAESYAWKHFISGHLGRLATREDVAVHRRYIADIVDSAHAALASVDPTPYFGKYRENAWAGVRGYLGAVTERAPPRSSTSTPGCWPRPTSRSSPPAPRS